MLSTRARTSCISASRIGVSETPIVSASSRILKRWPGRKRPSISASRSSRNTRAVRLSRPIRPTASLDIEGILLPIESRRPISVHAMHFCRLSLQDQKSKDASTHDISYIQSMDAMTPPARYEEHVMAPHATSALLSPDEALRARALKVIPGGMWGHMNVARLPPGYPQFFRSASGCRLWDVAGTEYVDLMCGYGPVVLGYGDPDVEAAAEKQRGRGDLMTGPAECQVELAELVVETIPHADWVLFAKNGTDAMTACVTIARAGTQRRKVLVAKGSYHGAAPWCTPSLAGVTAEDRAHILHFDYNDVASLERAADEAGRDLAAVLVTAFRHDVRRHQEAPTIAFAQAIRRICDAAGAALVLDDVRAGFRLHIGGSWE